MNLIAIAPTLILISHGYLQHLGAGFTGRSQIRLHVYLTKQVHSLKDSVSFSNR